MEEIEAHSLWELQGDFITLVDDDQFISLAFKDIEKHFYKVDSPFISLHNS